MKKEKLHRTHEKKEKQKSRKKCYLIVGIVAVVVIVGAVAGYLLLGKGGWSAGKEGASQLGQMMGAGQSEIQQGQVVSAYGIVSIGSEEETFPIEGATTSLVIEEVYVSSGDTITSETKLVKFTQSSLDAMEKELQDLYQAADLSYRAGLIELEQSKIQLEYERDMSLLEGEQAQEVYEETLNSLDSSVDRTKEQLDQAKEELSQYKEALANDTYYKEVETCQALYDENLALLKKYMDQWGVTWQQVTSKGGANPGNFRNEQEQYQYVLRNLYSVLESNLKDLEEAQTAYEDAVANANLEIQTLELSLPELEKAYLEAKQSYESRVLQANLTKETSLAEAQTAEKTYEAGLEKAEAEFDSLADAYELAKEDLEAFQTRIVDGCYYPEAEGELMRLSLRTGQSVSAASRVFTVRNTEELTVTVSVAQEYISLIVVGDSVIIQNSDNGIYQGVVASINPISTSTSQSSVNYSVTVEITDGAESATNNETVTVYFGLGGRTGNHE